MLEISSSHLNTSLIVAMKGRIDASSAKELEQQCLGFITAGNQQLIFDFSQVDYISSAGLRVILLIGKQLAANAGTLKLSAMNEIILNVFEISGFSKLFTIYSTVDEAIN